MTDEPRICVTEHRTNPERPRRAAEGSVLCRGCIEHARRNLEELPGRYEELAGALKPGRSHAQRVSGTPEKQLPIVPGVADHRGQIRSVLVSWALMVAEERGLHGPVAASPVVVAMWLGEHHDWSVRQPWASEYVAELGELESRARSMLYPSGAKFLLCGQCLEVVNGQRCGGSVVARIMPNDIGTMTDPSTMRCGVCGHEVETRHWLPYIERMQQDEVA